VGMTLEAIKQAISALPPEDKTSLMAWLRQQEAEAWDKQIELDFSEGGAGAPILEKWDAEIKAGKSAPLEEFLAEQEAGRKAK
jgi:hypothetical protein